MQSEPPPKMFKKTNIVNIKKLVPREKVPLEIKPDCSQFTLETKTDYDDSSTKQNFRKVFK